MTTAITTMTAMVTPTMMPSLDLPGFGTRCGGVVFVVIVGPVVVVVGCAAVVEGSVVVGGLVGGDMSGSFKEEKYVLITQGTF